jgi:hypothetical protein
VNGDATHVDRSPPRGAHPGGLGLLLLTAFLVAATVPALQSWTSRNQERQLRTRRAELDLLLDAGSKERNGALPGRDEGDGPRRSIEVPAGVRRVFEDTLVFSPQSIELFKTKGLREGEFERALKPPVTVTSNVTRDGVELSWVAPAELDALRAMLRDLPLLRLGFRVYRWREGEEPRLLSTFDASQTKILDRDLPLWRVRFFYCVATVLEGTIGDLPTLIESKRSLVMTVETLENFELEVLDGAADRARLRVSAWVEGEKLQGVAEFKAGQRVTAQLDRAGTPVEVDTGMTLDSLRVVDGTAEKTVQRAEFLPDGRRKLDPATGRPLFRADVITVPTRTLELRLNEATGATRTLTAQLSPASRD